jgi:hypothetical protein
VHWCSRRDDPASAGIDYQTMNAVIAADEFAAPATRHKTGASGLVSSRPIFYVLPGTPAFKVT